MTVRHRCRRHNTSGFGIQSNLEKQNMENGAKLASYGQFCLFIFTECRSLQYLQIIKRYGIFVGILKLCSPSIGTDLQINCTGGCFDGQSQRLQVLIRSGETIIFPLLRGYPYYDTTNSLRHKVRHSVKLKKMLQTGQNYPAANNFTF